MSKKSKRQYRKEASPAMVVKTDSAFSTPQPGTGGRVTFNPDYSYVVKDLRRIGVLAGSFIAILVILSFFLH